jgi:predicted ATPase
LTPFFGRQRELGQLVAMLRPTVAADLEDYSPQAWRLRILTVLGTGGSGKTRLAIEVGRACTIDYGMPVCFVSLMDADTPERMMQSIAEAVCPAASGDRNAFEVITSTLEEKSCLLVLDNLEQLVEACAETLSRLLQSLPKLTVLVTSRQRLGLDGEREFSLLPLPTPEREDTPECLMEFASVQLFVDRAQAARADFQLTPRNARSVGALCRRLEGLPLALELAASWAQTLSPAQMLARLDRRFELLRTRRKGMASRHQALDVCIDWSFRLLSPEVQAFFCRLCLLRAEWTLELGEIVAGDLQSLEKLQYLREASFLLVREVPDAEGTTLRFHMLESLREFGLERLDPREVNAGFERLTRYFSRFSGSDPFATVDTENVRAVVQWCRTSTVGHSLELDLLNALMHFWGNRGGWREGSGWVQSALERHTGATTPAQRKAWNTLGFLHAMLADNGQARACFERLLTDSKEAEDPVMAVRALSNLAIIAVKEGDPVRGCALMEQSLDQAERLGDARIIATQNYNVGAAHLELGHYEEARRFLDQSLQQSREQDFSGGIALCLCSLAQAARKEGDSLAARQMLEESLEIFRAHGEQPRVVEILDLLARVLEELGESWRARSLADESARLRERLQGD